MDKKCKKCKTEFVISLEEEDFFERISPKFGGVEVQMPLPTLCPDCRNQRRQTFRNDRVFYHRKCDMNEKSFISLYPEKSPYKVYCPEEWYGEDWNAMDFGMKVDLNRSFFEQYQKLQKKVPRLGIDIVNCQNSEYCNYCGDDKNCYLDIAGEGNEDCYYNLFVKYSKNTVDCTFVYNSELCYESINCYDSYGLQHCIYLDNCSECLYCFDLVGCKNCIFSHGLRNKEYCVFNKQYTKAKYEKYLKELGLGSYEQRQKLYEGWIMFKKDKAICRSNFLINCENSSGNNLKNCKNTFHSFNASGSEDCRYLYDVLDAKDCQDLNYSLYKPELSYELISTLNMTKSAFNMASHYNNEVFYCDLTNNSSNLFGCIGLNHKQYCILNRQYTGAQYAELVPQIIQNMKKHKEWGEFFPQSVNPFAYNETVADEYFPLTQKEAEKKGFRWIDQDEGEVVEGAEIADDIENVENSLCKEVLVCEKSGKKYKVIPQELKFYKKLGIPVPHRSPDQRHRDRIELRTSRKLWDRTCDKCGISVESAYESGCDEKVYCEECYRAKIY